MATFSYFLGGDFKLERLLLLEGFFQKGGEMKKSILYSCIAVFIISNLYGCWFLIGGAVGAAGAYVISKDTVQGVTDKPYDKLWSAAVKIARVRGTVNEEDRQSGFIDLEADSSRIIIKLVRLTSASTRLRVKARKYHLPNLDLAQDLYVRILEEAK